MRVGFVLLAALLAARLGAAAEPDASGPAAADKPRPRDVSPHHVRPIASPITDHFALRGSFFPASIATDVHVDSSAAVPGTELSAERDLGQANRLNQALGELIFRIRTRNRLRVNYFGSDRNASEVLNRDITFGGNTFHDRDVTQSELQFSMLSFTYLFSAIRTERFEVGVGLGAHLLQAEARATDQTLMEHAQSSGDGVLPTLAIDGTWRLSQRFAWTARANYVTANINGSTGSLGDYHTDVQYRWVSNFSVGLGYEMIRAQAQVTNSGTPGGFVFRVSGPEVFFRASF
ncbi:MAG TPA: hypothetical protein VII70_08685 [Steroidobacteraceae bacterium]